MSVDASSFIGIVDFSQEARWIYMTCSVTDLLGFEQKELIGKPSLDLVHPDEFPRIRQLHYDTIQQDKAAVLVYLRMRHKDPYKGYILCAVVGILISAVTLLLKRCFRTVVHNVLVGSVSYASPSKALHNASTAQEITVITPSAADFEFRRWNDPSPLPPSPQMRSMVLPGSPSPSSSWGSPSPRGSVSPRSRSKERSPSPSERGKREKVITFDHLPNQSFRTALIVDRFSQHCSIIYCSNDLLVSQTSCIGRSFFDFVAKRDEDNVRKWIDCVKGWGVNEKGHPSDGGFGFGRFNLLQEGRDSSTERMPEPSPTRSRQGSSNSRSRGTKLHTARSAQNRARVSPPIAMTSAGSQFPVDAIFSAHSDGLVVILRRATA